MTAEEYTSLKGDIGARGQDEPVWLYEKKILDGAHRARACRELGIEPTLREYEGDDPLGFVIGKNLHRRHLTPSQRAMIAAGVAQMPRGRPKKNGKVPSHISLDLFGMPAAEAAEGFGVSHNLLKDAKQLRSKAPQELVDAVLRGDLSIPRALRQLPGTSKSKKPSQKEPDFFRTQARQAFAPLTVIEEETLLCLQWEFKWPWSTIKGTKKRAPGVQTYIMRELGLLPTAQNKQFVFNAVNNILNGRALELLVFDWVRREEGTPSKQFMMLGWPPGPQGLRDLNQKDSMRPSNDNGGAKS
jgi:hypothetical protein